MTISLPANEAERLKALQQYQILDTPPEQAFDDIANLAAHLCDTPMALISLVDANRQWFKAKVGLNDREHTREISFCSHAVLEPDKLFIIPDTLADERFATNPLVTADPKIRFYAGAPLVTEEGYALGTLCVLDDKPRELTAEQKSALESLRRAVLTEFRLRRHVDLLSRTLAERDQAHAVLQEIKDELEIEVQERTAELQQTNRQLQQELVERQRAEAALAESEKRFQMAMKSAHDAIVISDESGQIVSWNLGAQNMFGYTEDEALGQPLSILMPEHFRPMHRVGLQRYLATGEKRVIDQTVELEGLKKDGTIFPVELSLSVRNIGGKHIFSGIMRNITERKQTEEQIRRNAAQAEALARIAGQLNAQLELQAVLDTVCEEAAHALNVPLAAVRLYDEQQDALYVGGSFGFPAGFPQLAPPWPRGLYEQILQEQQGAILVQDVQAAPFIPNAELYAQLNIRSAAHVPMKREEQLIGALTICTIGEARDFTSHELTLLNGIADQAAQAIANARLFAAVKRRANEFGTLYETAHDLATQQNMAMLLEIVVERAIKLVNATAGVIYLYDAQRNDLEIAVEKRYPVTPGTRLQLGEGLNGQVAQTRQPVVVDNYSTWSSRLPYLDNSALKAGIGVPMLFGGELIGTLSAFELESDTRKFTEADAHLLTLFAGQASNVVRDARLLHQVQQERALLAERVAARTAELSAANAELTKAARAKDEFLATMSHELRTPLNSILGLAEALQEQTRGPINEHQLLSLQTIEASGRHLLSLINDILDLSKIEADKLELQFDTVPVQMVGEASLQFVKQLAQQKQITVSFQLDNPLATLEADSRRLKQILVNLLSNAVKFTPEGGQVGLEIKEEPEQEVIHFMVWDTGIGIAAEHLSQLFKPFMQIDSRLARQYEGTGLGLVLIYRLAELHGGSVSVTSQVNAGSRFTVSLPKYRGLQPPETMTTAPAIVAVAPPVVQPEPAADIGAAPLILVAEDNEANILLFKDYLEDKGYRVVVARNGIEAIDRAVEAQPALILMDMQMPKMDGLEATHRIRGNPALAKVPIIALSGMAMVGDEERFLAAGVDDYLSKPVSLKGLISRIETHLKTEEGIN